MKLLGKRSVTLELRNFAYFLRKPGVITSRCSNCKTKAMLMNVLLFRITRLIHCTNVIY